MNAARRRTIPDGLPNRVYQKSGSWYWVPKDGSWIKLCRVDAGEPKMFERLAAEKRKRESDGAGSGDMPARVAEYVREKRGEHREDGWHYYGDYVKREFEDVNVRQVDNAHVVNFLSLWKGKLAMQRALRAFLKGFFQWCREKRYYAGENPCNGIKLKQPKPRDVYIPDDHFALIRARLDAINPMILCMVDLCYLTVQRSTEVRSLLWKQDGEDSNWVDRAKGIIHFRPSKTRDSSGLAIDWPITPEIEAVLERARGLGKIKSNLVIHNQNGKFQSDTSALAVWHRARNAVQIETVYTIKDIRAKALTDAERAGYDIKAIKDAAAHAKLSTTETYFKQRNIPLSEIHLSIPKSA
jgi:integrase